MNERRKEGHSLQQSVLVESSGALGGAGGARRTGIVHGDGWHSMRSSCCVIDPVRSDVRCSVGIVGTVLLVDLLATRIGDRCDGARSVCVGSESVG